MPLPGTTRSLTVRLIRGLFVAVVVAYVLVVGYFWYAQASFIFQPSGTVETTPGDLGVKFDKVTIPIGNDRLAGWWVPSEDPQAKTLLYLHGNATNIGANADQVVRLRRAGLNVFIFDYRGYGESTGGPPREKLVYEDAERAWTYLVAERKIAPANVAIYGHSLGGAVAVDLASRHPDAGALIAESTLTSVADVADGMGAAAYLPVRLILTERFDAMSRIGSVRVPKLILQGEADGLGLSMARRLYDVAPEPKQLAVIAGGGHNDSAEVNPTAYFGALNSFLTRYHFK